MLRLIVLATLLCLACGAARAAPLVPPPEFDYRPTMPVIELHTDNDRDTWRTCSANGQNRLVLPGLGGCQWFSTDGTVCFVLAQINHRDYAFAAILRHELAHCNGWVHE